MTLHSCRGFTESAGYGFAIESCVGNPEGELWASNGEYESQVGFCPFCGFKALKMPIVELENIDNTHYAGDRDDHHRENDRLEALFISLGYSIKAQVP